VPSAEGVDGNYNGTCRLLIIVVADG